MVGGGGGGALVVNGTGGLVVTSSDLTLHTRFNWSAGGEPDSQPALKIFEVVFKQLDAPNHCLKLTGL